MTVPFGGATRGMVMKPGTAVGMREYCSLAPREQRLAERRKETVVLLSRREEYSRQAGQRKEMARWNGLF